MVRLPPNDVVKAGGHSVTVATRGSFRRSLRFFELVSLGVGGTIGSGIFVVPALAARIAGPASLFAWVIVGVSACAVAFALASLQTRSSAGTAFTDLFRAAFGAPVAAAMVGAYLAGTVFGIATIAAGVGQYLAYLGAPHGVVVEMAAIGVFLVVNLAGIAPSGFTEDVLTVAKLVAIVGIALVLAPFVKLENLVPTRGVGARELLQAVVLVYWPFTGFEVSAIPVSETTQPSLIPRALLTVMLLVLVTYLGLNVALLGAVGAEALGASTAPVADAMASVLHDAGTVVALIALVTMASALNAYIVAASRVLQNAAEAFRLPVFAALSSRGAPAAALTAVCACAASMLLVSDRFASLATAAVLATLVPYVALCVAALRVAERRVAQLAALAGALSTAGILLLYLAW
jgi:amino acid transporter